MKKLKSIVKLTVIVCVALSVYAIVIWIVATVVPEGKGDDYIRSIEIVTSSAIIIGIVGLMYQIKQFKINAEQRKKHDFVLLTARYGEIQKLFLEEEGLSDLKDEILKRGRGKVDKEVNFEDMYQAASGKEITICSIMFQLMEDVYILEGLDVDEEREHLAGWNRLFRDWIGSDRVWAIWLRLSGHFGNGFNGYVKACRKRE